MKIEKVIKIINSSILIKTKLKYNIIKQTNYSIIELCIDCKVEFETTTSNEFVSVDKIGDIKWEGSVIDDTYTEEEVGLSNFPFHFSFSFIVLTSLSKYWLILYSLKYQ